MKVFVTGGAGFIGAYLIKSLNELGHDVVVFDNFSHSSDLFLKNGKNITCIKGDILNQNQLSESIKKSDIVIHLAAQIDVERSINDPKETFDINVKGTENLLLSCVENKILNFIAISSAAVYGHVENHSIKENFSTNPISPYGESKLLMEKKIIQYSNNYNLNSLCLRLFNVYGKGQTDGYAGVITKFLEKIQRSEPLEIFGDGIQSRDFIYISDVIDAIILSIKKIENKNGECYNIGTETSISINELGKIMLKLFSKNLEIIHMPSKKGDIQFSQASMKKTKNELDFMPKISLKEGLMSLSKNIKI
jgi:UDP-glucose 4-epimerase